jgi:hypothetical protein
MPAPHEESPMSLEFIDSRTKEWVVHTAYQAEYIKPPASIQESEFYDAESDFYDDRGSSICTSTEAKTGLASEVKSKDVNDAKHREDDEMEEEGTIKGGNEVLNKRDFRVILTEIYHQSEMIKLTIIEQSVWAREQNRPIPADQPIHYRENDHTLKGLASMRLKTLQGFLDVVIDRIDQELANTEVQGDQED